MWIQRNITIEKKQKGFHLITDQLIDQIPEINNIYIGLLHVFILHTSASITLNENMDGSVRDDFKSFLTLSSFELLISLLVSSSLPP